MTGNATLPFVPLRPARKQYFVRVACDGHRVGFACQYFDGAADLMKHMGATWLPSRRMWVIKVADMHAFLTAMEDVATREHPFWDFTNARDLAAAAWRQPVREYFVEALDVQLIPLESGGFACSCSFDQLFREAVRSLGGIYQKAAASWEVRKPLAAILSALDSIAGIDESFVYVHDDFMRLEQAGGPGQSPVPIVVGAGNPPQKFDSAASEASTVVGSTNALSCIGDQLRLVDVDEPALKGLSEACGLRDYQTAGVRFMAGRSSALNGDDMGVGKTRQGAVAARLVAGEDMILVVSPASLCINWQREISAIFPNDEVALMSNCAPSQWSKAKWLITNYERLGSLVKRSDLKLGVMLLDEAHSIKEYGAGRTRHAFMLRSKAKRLFLLSGTPILNREVELHTLLRLSNHRLGHLQLAEFRDLYSGTPEKRALLAQELSDWMIRRGKDALKDLGTKSHEVLYISPPEGLASYDAIVRDSTIPSMAKLTRLRQHLEALKVEYVVSAIRQMPLADKALIFCEFTDTVSLLSAAFRDAGIGAVSLMGTDSIASRQRAIDALQGDDTCRVFVGTTKAAGVGITLTRSNWVWFMSLPWTPALKRQAEDRAYRSGQVKDVYVRIPIVAGTLDDQVLKLQDAKQEIESAVIERLRQRVA